MVLCTNAQYKWLMEEKKIKNSESCCDVNGIFKIIGGKWKVLLIKTIAQQCPKRFGELRRDMEDMAQTTLTLQLRELERDGIICRQVYLESPPRVEYKLSEMGKTILPVIDMLDEWWEAYKMR
ncbi:MULTISPECIES: winged helix-turn-helix transcriptional regulator [Sphingobacterium]|uniref:winged helix-turn-helix transcriptional regulator n=1 Tax=Sphingobacterium TaxID=28453 RepID=UPI001047528E|nr:MULTISPECIES: helix-turn-helix domain-containing protein [Sphingobacterium]MBB2950376.1 DNA-binding HxlR family transcriptional regulator [Sphingobacterium sp. JUb56]MCW2258897.1 DNA-binding HxlR family transcriptional regulator [Sphingobacterium kitahiroshimense]QQD12972.1 helix-turn-helix transcriptional regulator [Sphingobacterium sp. UDSM-2020]TCR14650.1 HxlR family transcriptional regulator [Sphingobacterium sp. JUb78]